MLPLIIVVLYIPILKCLGVDNFMAASGQLEKIGDKVCWKYKREKAAFIAYLEMITDFTSMEFTAESPDQEISLVTIVQPPNQNFIQVSKLPKEQTVPFTLLPQDFRPSSSSDEFLDTTKIRQVPAFVDLQSIVNPDGSDGQICFYTNLTFTYDNLKVKKGNIQIVNQDLVISESTKIDGDIFAFNSRLIIEPTCTRFEMTGNIVLMQSSQFLMSDGAWIFHEHYNHEHSIIAYNGSRVDWNNGVLFMYSPYTLVLAMNSIANLTDIHFLTGSFTCSQCSSCGLYLDNVIGFGETLVPSHSTLHATNIQELITWVTFQNVTISEPITLPPSPSSQDFDSKSVPGLQNWDISLHKSEKIQYGIILEGPSTISISETHVRAVGMMFTLHSGYVGQISNIKNGETYENTFVQGEKGQGIHLEDSSVESWNFYATSTEETLEGSYLEISGSLFGESIAYKNAIIHVINSTCDGTGGYLGTQDSSEMRISESIISTRVIASGSSKMYFSDSTINGDVYVQNGVIVLKNTKVRGSMIKTGNGTIVVQ